MSITGFEIYVYQIFYSLNYRNSIAEVFGASDGRWWVWLFEVNSYFWISEKKYNSQIYIGACLELDVRRVNQLKRQKDAFRKAAVASFLRTQTVKVQNLNDTLF